MDETKAFADNPYATPQGFYSTPKAREMGLHKFFRALRWLGMAGTYIDPQDVSAVGQFPFYFDIKTMKEIRDLLSSPSLQEKFTSFAVYSGSLAGDPDSISFQMLHSLKADASAKEIVEAVRQKAKELDIPKLAKANGIPFTALPTAYTATQAAYEGVQMLGDRATLEEFEKATNVMTAYLGNDPNIPEVKGILNDLPKEARSAYELMLSMGARLRIADETSAPYVLNMFAGAETTAAEAVVGLEKQQQALRLSISGKNEVRLDPAITKEFVAFAKKTQGKLAKVAEANGIHPYEMENYVKLESLLDEMEKMLEENGTKYIIPLSVAQSLGPLIELFNQDPTAAVKVAEYNNLDGAIFTRVNAVLPMEARREIDGVEYIYGASMFGTQAIQVSGASDLLTRQKLLELRRQGKLPENFSFMLKGQMANGEDESTPHRRPAILGPRRIR